jgi:thiol-disulfide isomerase/thioredoxin
MSADGGESPGSGSPPGSGSSEGGDSSRRRPARAYSIFVGLAFIALIIIAGINSLRTSEGGVLGAGDERGTALAQFAVPEARGPVEGDANVYQDDCATSELPCPEDQVRTPACEIAGPDVDSGDVIRVCDLFDKPLVISFWFTRGGDCLPTQDVVDEVASRYRGRVNFLSVNVRDERESVREIIAERGWEISVGHDADGAVSNIYRVGVCPTVAFAYPGGILRDALVGSEELGGEQLVVAVEELIAESRRRAAAER